MQQVRHLLLASQSASRRELLEEARISFRLVEQVADERACPWTLPIEELVQEIAYLKMVHVVMPDDLDRDCVHYILTADTLTQDSAGLVYGKPASHEDAVTTLRALRHGQVVTATGFRLERRVWRGGWLTDAVETGVVAGSCHFAVPDAWIDRYIENSIALSCAGSMAIEGYGSRFVHTISGSYTAIMGLPLYEVQIALDRLGFFDAA